MPMCCWSGRTGRWEREGRDKLLEPVRLSLAGLPLRALAALAWGRLLPAALRVVHLLVVR